MKYFIAIFSALLIMFSGCKTQESKPSGNARIMNPQNAKDVAGTYMGMIPCADCVQTICKLELKSDYTYKLSLTYMGKSNQPAELTGSFSFIRNGDIMLDKKTPGMQYYRKNSDGLLMLDTEGKVISGDLAERYQLRPAAVPEQPEPVRNKNDEKWNAGVDFYAAGNEPGWTLDIDPQTGFTFTLQDGRIVRTPPAEGVKDQQSPAVRYRAITESNELIITVTEEKCSNSMSGEKFSHMVKVEWRPVADSILRNYTGCGRFTIDPALSGKWRLMSVDGASPDTSGLMKGSPVLEFEPSRGRLSGHAGCNVISGSFYTSSLGKIVTSALASTKMACPGMDKEAAFVAAISETILNFEIDGVSMRLTSRKGKTMLFQKIY